MVYILQKEAQALGLIKRLLNELQVYGGAKRRQFCLQSLGTKETLHTLPTLQNNKPVPQVLKQVVNLSCLFWNDFQNGMQISQYLVDRKKGF